MLRSFLARVASRLRFLRTFLLKLNFVNVDSLRIRIIVLALLPHDVEVERVLILGRPFDVFEEGLILEVALHFAEVFLLSPLRLA